MTKYEIRVTQTCRDYYRVEADNSADAEKKLWTWLSRKVLTGKPNDIELNDTIDSSPKIDYTVQLSPEGEPIL